MLHLAGMICRLELDLQRSLPFAISVSLSAPSSALSAFAVGGAHVCGRGIGHNHPHSLMMAVGL